MIERGRSSTDDLRENLLVETALVAHLAGIEQIAVREAQFAMGSKNAATFFAEHDLDNWRLVFPRKIAIPNGFPGLGGLAVQMHALLTSTPDSAIGSRLSHDLPAKAQFVTSARLCAVGTPVYFVSRAVLSALMRSEPPDDYTFGNLQWPLPAMAFVLPSGAVHSPRDGSITVLAITSVEPGPVYHRFVGVHGRPTTSTIDVPHSGYAHFALTSAGVSFAGIHAVRRDSPLKDAIVGDDPAFSRASHHGLDSVDVLSDDDAAFGDALASLGLRILLLLNARADLLSEGRQLRKGSSNPKKAKTELWEPNFIGKDYRVRGGEERREGLHTSPRMHWRRGHYRSQPHGPVNSLRKLIWIEPVLVAADSSEESSTS